MIFHFADGREIAHEWEKLVHPRPKHTEEYKEQKSKFMKAQWTDERRRHMSEHMKKLRKEESHRWQRK